MTASGNWEEKFISEIATEVHRSVKPIADERYELWSVPSYATGEPEVLDGSEIGSAKLQVQPWDVLVCKINPRINRIWVVRESPLALPQIASPEWLILRFPEESRSISAPFVANYLSGPKFRYWITGAVSGVTGSHTRAKSRDIFRQRIPFPPLAEQQRISLDLDGYLSHLDTGFGAMKRATVLADRLILTALLRATINNVEVSSWDTATIGQVAKVSTGATPLRTRADYYENGTIPWVTSGLLNKPYIDATDKMITELALQETSVKLFPPGTLLVAMYGEGRTRGRCSELRISATTNQACAAIQLYPEYEDLRAWVKLVLEASYHRMRKLAAGGVQPNLSLGLVQRIRIPIPPRDVQAEIIDDVRKLRDSEARLDQTLASLRAQGNELREAIFRYAFEGR